MKEKKEILDTQDVIKKRSAHYISWWCFNTTLQNTYAHGSVSVSTLGFPLQGRTRRLQTFNLNKTNKIPAHMELTGGFMCKAFEKKRFPNTYSILVL